MSATDELRRLLDGRGIEYYPKAADETVFSTGTEHVHVQDDLIDGCLELFIRPVTPEQAVEATLGSDLKAENEQLRKERDFYFQQVTENGERTHEAIDAFNAENVKLRELLQDIADHIKHGDGFGIDRGWMLDRMRELGVDA